MSGPVPSPSMNGMIGWAGTLRMPSAMVIFSPPAGGVGARRDPDGYRAVLVAPAGVGGGVAAGLEAPVAVEAGGKDDH